MEMDPCQHDGKRAISSIYANLPQSIVFAARWCAFQNSEIVEIKTSYRNTFHVLHHNIIMSDRCNSSNQPRTRQPSAKQFYIRESFIDVEEDMQHEFKGHRTICAEEHIESYTDPATGRHTRRPISRNICGFLNTGKGGTIYLGVTDNGQIFGIPRTLYQKDHLRLSVQDTLSRFTPAVPRDLYEVRFVPVISVEDAEDFDPERYTYTYLDGPQRYEPHKLRLSRYCWCDSDAQARFVNGFLPDEYVIEIEIFPWDQTNPALESIAVSKDVPIHQLFTTETGNCYIRGQGGVVELTPREVAELSMAQTREYYKRKILELQEKIGRCSHKSCV